MSGDGKQSVIAQIPVSFTNIAVRQGENGSVQFSENVEVYGTLNAGQSRLFGRIKLCGDAFSVTEHTFDGDVFCGGTLSDDLTVTGNFTVASELKLNHAKLNVKKDLTVNYELWIKDSEVTVDRDLIWNSKLNMTEDAGYLHVKGNANAERTGYGTLIAGVLEIEGDYVSKQTKAEASHRFIFSGAGK